MSFLSVAITSGVLLLLLAILFVVEERRGMRYAHRVREMLDHSLEVSVRTYKRNTPHLNSRFFRQSFHYLTHKLLTGLLALLRGIERSVTQAAQFNRTKARAASAPSEHLTLIAEHKERAQLSEKEKKERRAQALRGE